MRASCIVVLAATMIMASISEISATTDKSELPKVNRGLTTRSIEGVHDTPSRFLRGNKITDDYEGVENEERTGEAAQLAAKLDGLLPTFMSVSQMKFTNAWHHLQMMNLTMKQRYALLDLHKLSLEDRKAVINLIKS